MLREPFRRSNRPKNLTDESFDAFLTRRFGEAFARTFGSALVHGIYAADSRNLSVRAAFPSMWNAEERGWGSVVRGFMLRPSSSEKHDYHLGDVPRLLNDASVYSFQDGMQTLTSALERDLLARSNVHILRDVGVTSLELQIDQKFKVCPSRIKVVSLLTSPA